jgi:hypothetical protein
MLEYSEKLIFVEIIIFMLLVARQNKLERFSMDFFGNKAKEARVFFSGCE